MKDKINILVVDDNKNDQYLLESVFYKENYNLKCANNGKQALESLEKGSFDIIISDIFMPVMDGFQFCQKVRSNPDYNNIIFVIYSSTYKSDEDEQFAYKLGVNKFLKKPIEPEKLLKIINDLFLELSSNPSKPTTEAIKNEKEILELYNKRLVEKLEHKVLELEREIGDHKRTEEQLDRLATAIECAAEDVTITNIHGEIEYVNPAFEKVTGYTKKEVMGKNPNILKSGKHEKSYYRILWNTITSGEVWKGRFINKRKDDNLIVQDASIAPIISNSNKTIGFVAVKRDITQQISLESQLLQAQKLESIGSLASGLVHDFNNMLNGIIAASSLIKILLKKEKVERSKKINSALDAIFETSYRSADMIHQLLTLSRKEKVEFVTVDVNYSLKHIIKICQNTFPKSITIETSLSENPLNILADPTQIEQALLNICVNAAHAMTIMKSDSQKKSGTLTLSSQEIYADKKFCQTRLNAKEDNTYVLLTIKDTGVGMSKETKDKIFEPFFTTKDKEVGTGLGLAMVNNFIKFHNGFLECDSSPGEGTVFRMYFPKQLDEKNKQIIDSEQNQIILNNGTVLIVDDDKTIRLVVKDILLECGYEVLTAANGISGIELYKKNADKIDAVLLDMEMPELSGLEVYEKLQEINAQVKVLITSGYSKDARVTKALTLGANGYLQKPFSALILSQELKKLIN